MSDYEKQAQEFLAKTNTTFSVSFCKYDRYFHTDAESRNVYLVTLKNDNHKYTFTFGQSIAESAKNNEPNAYDVLACLTKYDVGTLNDFINEFCYDFEDSNTKKIYKAVCKEYDNLCLLFSEEDLELLRDIN